MGAADVVPGVSGGTMALIVGIYERLLESVRVGLESPFLLVTGRPRRAWASLREVDWGLVVPLAGGILIALVSAAGVIPVLMETHPEASRGLFFGLIVASVAVPWQALTRRTGREMALIVASTVAAFVLTGLPALAPVSDPSALRIFLSASVAICAMILPGVSGSFLLLVLGMYQVTLDALHVRDLPYVATFVLGAALGLGLFSRLLTRLLADHPDATMAVLVGLMIGSLRALWPWQTDTRELLPPGDHLPLVIGLAVLGIAVVTALMVVASRLSRETPGASAVDAAQDVEAHADRDTRAAKR